MLSTRVSALSSTVLYKVRPIIAARSLGTSTRAMAEQPSALAEFGKVHIAGGLKRLTDTIVESGEGSYVTTEGGNRLLDFTCGIGVANLGHCHPKVSKAAADQCLKVTHVQCSIAFSRPYLELVQKLLPLMPHPSLDTFFLWNSGAEAIEAAIKLARASTKRQNIVVVQGGYHGRTYGTMSLTRSKTVYSLGQHPLMPGVYTTPFPYWHQMGLPQSTPSDQLVESCLTQLDLLLHQQTAPADTAAILLEPVLGEGGYVAAPAAFLQGLRDVCDKHGILLIIDEVQSGFGRTGKMFACEYSGVRPDILVMAKGIANGFPLSGIVSRKELMDTQPAGTIGGTYAGNAVACAAAVAVADVFREEKVLENVNARSAELFSALNALKADAMLGPLIADVRGQGLMVGVEFTTDKIKGLSSRVAGRCIQKGMLILTTSVFEVIRFIPPLTVSKEEMAQGIQIFREALEEVAAQG